jgi:hypothetical protein
MSGTENNNKSFDKANKNGASNSNVFQSSKKIKRNVPQYAPPIDQYPHLKSDIDPSKRNLWQRYKSIHPRTRIFVRKNTLHDML